MNKSAINLAVAAVLVSSAPVISASTQSYNWTGIMTMLDPTGYALANPSISAKGSNQFLTPISGTMTVDVATGAGTATMMPFDYFNGSSPAEATSINLQAIGDGMGGAGTLVIGNMLFNWNGINGIPVSVVLDATGFFGSTSGMWNDGVLDQADVDWFGAVPASDGTYLNSTFGYLNIGPVPMATTEWNLTNGPVCLAPADTDFNNNIGGGCMSVETSGMLPLIADTATNSNEWFPVQGDGVGVGGVPMWDGPFTGFSPNFEFTTLTYTGSDPNDSIAPFCVDVTNPDLCNPPDVPVPAAIWLFSSGLMGLIGFSRNNKCSKNI